MTEHTSLDDILNGTQTQPSDQDQGQREQDGSQVAEHDPVPVDSAQGENVEPAEQQDVQDEPPTSGNNGQQQQSQLSERERAFLASVQDERSRRQEAEKRFNDLEQQIQTLQQSQTQNEQDLEPEPDPYLDTENYLKTQLEKFQERFQTQNFETRVDISQEMMRQIHQDYDEVESVFVQAANQNPALAAQMMQHPNPAKFAYETGKSLKFQQEIGSDPEAYKNNLRDKLKLEILEEFKAEQAKANQANASAQRPTSLADASSSGNRKGPEPETHTPLDDLL